MPLWGTTIDENISKYFQDKIRQIKTDKIKKLR